MACSVNSTRMRNPIVRKSEHTEVLFFWPFSGRVVLKLPNIEKEFHYWLPRNRVAHKKFVSYQDKDNLIVQGSIANLRCIVIMPKTLITSCQVDQSSKKRPNVGTVVHRCLQETETGGQFSQIFFIFTAAALKPLHLHFAEVLDYI